MFCTCRGRWNTTNAIKGVNKMPMTNYDDYITAIRLGIPLKAMDGANIRRQANTALYANAYLLNSMITYEYALGTYQFFISSQIDEDLYILPVPFEAPNHIMAEKIKITKQAYTATINVGYYDLDNNSTGQGESLTLNELEFANYCGQYTQQGLIIPDPETPFSLVFAASDYEDVVSHYSIGLAIAAPISQVGYDTHPQIAGLEYYTSYSSGSFTRELMHAQFDGVYYDPEQAVPTGGSDGGGGLFSRPDEEIPIPSLPALSLCDTNFISIYKVDSSELADLANFLWSSSFFDNIIKNWTSPMENIISLGIINYPLAGSLQNVVIGNMNSGIQGEKLATTFFEVDCGNKNIEAYYKNFADYDTGIQIMLPYIGAVRLDASDCMRGVINVVYHFDVFTGSCTAYIRCRTAGAWHVLHQYNGQIKVELPITGRSFIEAYKSILNVVGAATSGNVLGVVSSASDIKPTYQRSGNAGGTSGYMGVQYPYIIYSTPQLIEADKFRQIKGYVSNLKVNISDLSGFVSASIDNVDMIGFDTATDDEVERIKTLLAEGIYIE